MTPNDAQIILKSVEASGEDLGIGYRLALETIAGMREEWGVSYRWANDDTARIEWGNDTREEAVKWAHKMENYPGSRAYVFGIVRRYVTNEEEA